MIFISDLLQPRYSSVGFADTALSLRLRPWCPNGVFPVVLIFWNDRWSETLTVVSEYFQRTLTVINAPLYSESVVSLKPHHMIHSKHNMSMLHSSRGSKFKQEWSASHLWSLFPGPKKRPVFRFVFQVSYRPSRSLWLVLPAWQCFKWKSPRFGSMTVVAVHVRFWFITLVFFSRWRTISFR